MAGKSIPTGVKIISVLYYIGAVFGVIFGLLFLFGAGAIADALAKSVPFVGAIGAGIFAIVGIVFLAFGILGFFVGRGLWNGRSWARIVAIIFACLGILSSLSPFNIIGLVLHLVIGGYLLFNADVKKAFA